MSENETVSSLREALKVSPNNLPLREILAQTLLGLGRAEEAEQEYRQALGAVAGKCEAQIRAGQGVFAAGKKLAGAGAAGIAFEGAGLPAIGASALCAAGAEDGNVELAERHYQKAISADPSLADLDLAKHFRAPVAAREEEAGDYAVPVAAGDQEDDSPTTLDSDVERPKVNFKDVGGMEVVKDEIRMKIIHPLAHPELYAAYGKKIGGGILMYGPPGCGKTHLARATAGEIKASFISVGISDVLDMWIGSSERNLHELFEQARRNKPCVLFFDEVDAAGGPAGPICGRRRGRHLINQFLSEMDGLDANNDGVLILAATNAPWHVDAAFRRPGRFDRILFVPPPDAPARAAILRILTTGKPVKDLDYDQVANKTEAFSGADMKAVVDVAIEAKLKQAMKSGGGIPPITTKDLAAAAGSIKPSTRDWFASARNYALYSNQGGTYDDILKYLKLS